MFVSTNATTAGLRSPFTFAQTPYPRDAVGHVFSVAPDADERFV
jgi:hypothetical protein